MASSRQSPNRSAVSEGVDLVPLLEAPPEAVSRTAPPAFWMVIPSSNSRSRSPSHQARKLVLLGEMLTTVPEALRTPPAAPQNSAPGLEARMSAAAPRPTSSAGVFQYTWPVRALRKS